MKRLLFGFVVALIIGGHLGCASAPPNLTPPGVKAWQNARIQTGLDVVRDIALAAGATVAPISASRSAVQWHRSAIVILHERGNGAKPIILASLDELRRDLPPRQQEQWGPYIDLAKGILTITVRDVPLTDAETIAAYEAAFQADVAQDDAWLTAHEFH